MIFLMYELQNGFRMALMTNPQSSVLKFLFLSKSFNPQFSILNPQFSGFLVFKYVIQSSILSFLVFLLEVSHFLLLMYGRRTK